MEKFTSLICYVKNSSARTGILFLFFLLLLPAGLNETKGSSVSDSLVNAAWQEWQKPDYPQAAQLFSEAIKADPADERPYLGLALLKSMLEKHHDYWTALQSLTENTTDYYPYLSSFWFNIRFRIKDEYEESGVMDLLEKLAENADELGVIKAQATETIEEYYREKNELSEANIWRKKLNTISDWKLIGPFENVSASGYDKAFPPENEFKPDTSYEGKSSIPATWFSNDPKILNTWIDLTQHFAFKQAIYYANTFVYSPETKTVLMRVGTSGSLKTFLNDQLIIECPDENNNDLDTYIAKTQLQQGWNRVLIKCGFSEIDRCNFLVRITDEKGNPVEGLRVSTRAQSYPKNISVNSEIIQNKFELFFKNQIEQHPNFPENYALLAQMYLRDDKAPQAEVVIRSALEKWPRCTLFYTLLMEAYGRDEKSNEIADLIVQVSTIDGDLPIVVSYKINEAIRNEEYQQVPELLKKMTEVNQNEEAALSLEMGYLGKRKEIDQLVALVKKAYAKYPANWEFVKMRALVETEINRDLDKAIDVVKVYLDHKYGLDQLSTLANYYLKSGNFEKWEAAMNEALNFSPSLTNYVYSKGLVYQLVKAYPQAEEALSKALSICPNSSLVWSKLGEVYKAQGKTNTAIAAYTSSLKYDSRNYDSREALRELEGKKPIYSSFISMPVDSLVRNAPDKSEYPNDNSVILLDDSKRVVFDKGASILFNELMVKVFNAEGIDNWKEYYVSYNSYNEEMIVEKAVTIKANGTEIKADISNEHIVFKSTEPNDVIYIKWKIKNYYSGMLSQHFWDTFYFNSYFPIRLARYSLIVPDDVKFAHKVQLTDDSPIIKKVDDGLRYEWRLENEPAIMYEQGMPNVQDVAKILFVSSLPSWDYVANWYADIAQTKTKATFEIKNLIADLFKDKPDLDPEEKVETIYDYITNNIRYSSVSFRQSAYTPQNARNVLVHRLGDCKDVSTLCISLLHEVGINAYYVLVNTWDYGLNNSILPSISFNHCIVGLDINGGTKYLDLTASDYPLGSVSLVVNNSFALPIKNGVQQPTYLQPLQFSPNSLKRTSYAELKEDNSLTFECISQRSGTYGADIRSRYKGKTESERNKILTEILSSDYPNVKVNEVTTKEVDGSDGVAEDNTKYFVPKYLTDAGGFKLLQIPWTDKLVSLKPLSYETRKYPFILASVNDTTKEVLHIKFPKGYSMTEKPKNVNLTNSICDYSLEFEVKNEEMTATRTFILKKFSVEPEEYVAFKELYNDALSEDTKQFLLKK